MYNLFLEEELDEEVSKVFEDLRDASIKHLNAFTKNADNEVVSKNKNSQNRNGKH
jgi:rubrerythrin